MCDKKEVKIYKLGSKCEIHNDVAETENMGGVYNIPERLMDRHSFCRILNAFKCDKADCPSHVDFKGA